MTFILNNFIPDDHNRGTESQESQFQEEPENCYRQEWKEDKFRGGPPHFLFFPPFCCSRRKRCETRDKQMSWKKNEEKRRECVSAKSFLTFKKDQKNVLTQANFFVLLFILSSLVWIMTWSPASFRAWEWKFRVEKERRWKWLKT